MYLITPSLSSESIDFLQHKVDAVYSTLTTNMGNLTTGLGESVLNKDIVGQTTATAPLHKLFGNNSLNFVAHLSLIVSKKRLWMDRNATEPVFYPLEYRIIATILHGLLFVLGVGGNILVVIVVRRTKSMHVPTYCYLESLAVADLLVIWASIPEAVVSYHLYAHQWIFGQLGCSLLVFFQFFGINASSLSILAFTVERFIAICQPLRAKSICTLQRAKKIIIALWIIAFLSACPWLGLTLVVRTPYFPEMDLCHFRVSRQKLKYIFGADLVLFYVIPLITASILYSKIGLALRKRTTNRSGQCNRAKSQHTTQAKLLERKAFVSWQTESNEHNGACSSLIVGDSLRSASAMSVRNARIKVVRMLFVIVVLFAVLWLPYRGIMLYNTFANQAALNKWMMLFCKTCIFLNSSINPILYNAMSKRFRKAFSAVLTCQQRKTLPVQGAEQKPLPLRRATFDIDERPSKEGVRYNSNHIKWRLWQSVG